MHDTVKSTLSSLVCICTIITCIGLSIYCYTALLSYFPLYTVSNNESMLTYSDSDYIGEWKGSDLKTQTEMYVFYENKTGIYINLSTCEHVNFHWMHRNSEWITSEIIYPSDGDISTFYMVTATNMSTNNGSFYKIETPN